MTDEIYVNMTHFPTLALGPGKRAGVWMQGCTIRCAGCMSKHTWEFNEKYKIKIKDLVKALFEYKSKGAQGLTISGGEPFDQPGALYVLLKKARNLDYGDIIAYSGYSYEYLSKNFSETLDLIDVLIDGPFVDGARTSKPWKGSRNQDMVILSRNPETIKKYENIKRSRKKERPIQVVEKNGAIYIIGVTKQGDSEDIIQKLT